MSDVDHYLTLKEPCVASLRSDRHQIGMTDRHHRNAHRRFADAYVSCGGRERPEIPLYFETDKFLNFLYHHAEGTPSKEYKARGYLIRSEREITDTITAYRQEWREARQPDGPSVPTLMRQFSWS